MGEKRYHWLKLKDDFFSSKRIKKLRKLAGGDTYTIIYLKMQLVAMKHDGIITFTGLEKSFADELALELDETPENVTVTVQYLLSCGLLETSDDIHFFIPYAVENTQSEAASTQRSRLCRERRKALQCNDNATQAQQKCNKLQQNCSVDIEKDIDIEIEKEIEEVSNDTSCAELEKSDSTPPVISLILNDKSFFDITEEDVTKWSVLYPAVDVMQELRKMAGWCESNTTKRKTRRGVRALITSWVARAQDRGGSQCNLRNTNQSLREASSSNPFLREDV